MKIEKAYAKQNNGNWSPLTLEVTLRDLPKNETCEPAHEHGTLYWIDWADVESIMGQVRTTKERDGNWHTLKDGGGLPDVSIFSADNACRPMISAITKVNYGLGCIVQMVYI